MEIGNAQRAHDPALPKKWGHLTMKPPTISDYVGTPVEHSKRMILWLMDRQPTSPQKVGAMIWEVIPTLFGLMYSWPIVGVHLYAWCWVVML